MRADYLVFVPQIFMRGIRVYSWSGFEQRAFGSPYYEIKKKVAGQFSNLSSAWASFWPAVIGVYGLIKWAEHSFDQEQRSHRD